VLCAGITTYKALRNSGARGGDLVAIPGMRGLGHLGIQFAAKLGFRTVAITRGTDKEPLARELGAHAYIDSPAGNTGKALQAMGGAKVILSTISSGASTPKSSEDWPLRRAHRRRSLPRPNRGFPNRPHRSQQHHQRPCLLRQPGLPRHLDLRLPDEIRPRIETLALGGPARPTPRCSPATQGSEWS
jgi:hypothetical protein